MPFWGHGSRFRIISYKTQEKRSSYFVFGRRCLEIPVFAGGNSSAFDQLSATFLF
jgi:hypothetical protein